MLRSSPVYKTETSKELVRKLASESPIAMIGELNACKFCELSWAENNFADWLKNEQILQDDPEAIQKPIINTRLRWYHHRIDCLWIRANQTVARDL